MYYKQSMTDRRPNADNCREHSANVILLVTFAVYEVLQHQMALKK